MTERRSITIIVTVFAVELAILAACVVGLWVTLNFLL